MILTVPFRYFRILPQVVACTSPSWGVARRGKENAASSATLCLISYEPAKWDLMKRQHRHRRVIGDWQRQLIWEPFLSLCNIVLAHANENKTVDGCPNITESFYLTSVDDDNLHVQWSNTVRLCFSALLHLYLDSLYLPR